MLCAISGEAPQHPVASRKSGTVYEKSLIESYISQHGTDPVDGSELTLDDLVELRTARTVRPRPPNFTSIPSLISAFQNEWDALALESFELRKHLSQLRQELSTALYNNDAAVRVIARLTKERDEAREALSKVSVGGRGAGAANGHANTESEDAMLVDDIAADGISKEVDFTQEKLSKTRRKRPIPEDWATPDTIQEFELRAPTSAVPSVATSFAASPFGDLVLAGSTDGSIAMFSVTSREVELSLQGKSGAIVDGLLWTRGERIKQIVMTDSGEIAVFDEGEKVLSFAAHSGPGYIALHPSQTILASAGMDKNVVLYNMAQRNEAIRIISDAAFTTCAFHPDGHLLAAGSKTGAIKIFDVKTMTVASTFETNAPVSSLSFSENGFWLAVAHERSTSVSIWDLRKMAEIKSLEFGGQVDSVRFDYTGQYLAGVGPAGVTVQYYDKGSKSWSSLLQKGLAARAVEWGPQAKSLVVLMVDGSLTMLQ